MLLVFSYQIVLCRFVGSDGLQGVIIYNVPDDPKKKNRGFTFLDFDCHKTAAAAKKRLATCRVFGCDIIVDWADPLEEPDEETMSKACCFIWHCGHLSPSLEY